MTDFVPKLLACGSNHFAALTDVYTVPANKSAIIKSIIIQGGSSGNRAKIAVKRPGVDAVYVHVEAATDVFQEYYDLNRVNFRTTIIVHAGDKLQIQGGTDASAPVGYVHYTVSGLEFDQSEGAVTTTAGA